MEKISPKDYFKKLAFSIKDAEIRLVAAIMSDYVGEENAVRLHCENLGCRCLGRDNCQLDATLGEHAQDVALDKLSGRGLPVALLDDPADLPPALVTPLAQQVNKAALVLGQRPRAVPAGVDVVGDVRPARQARRQQQAEAGVEGGQVAAAEPAGQVDLPRPQHRLGVDEADDGLGLLHRGAVGKGDNEALGQALAELHLHQMADAQFTAHVGRDVVVVGVRESDFDVDDDFGV